ncbi:hypothetical protein FRB99_001585 [Tulasnella sp. 403]|nr:hypothetical protein FRB99_001585 [Tulasnella sp. 403]
MPRTPPSPAGGRREHTPLNSVSNSPTYIRIRRPPKSVNKAQDSQPASTEVPSPVLLLSLPPLFTYPPDHPNHIPGLHASLDALRRCLALHSQLGEEGNGTLSFEQEMRAHGMLAEVGMKVIAAGLSCDGGPAWANGIENEVDEAVTAGTRLCQQIANLRPYRLQFSLFRAHLMLWQHQLKTCRAFLKRELSSITSSDSSATVYTCYFTFIASLLSTSMAPGTPPPDIPVALTTLQTLRAIATNRGDVEVATFCLATRLQILVHAEMWDLIGEACDQVEEALGLTCTPPGAVTEGCTDNTSLPAEKVKRTPLYLSMKIHALILLVIYYTHTTQPRLAALRLGLLHDALDSDALSTFPDGVVSVTLSTGPPMLLNVTHPRVLYELAFLVSALSKAEVSGRKSRKKLFVLEGLTVNDETPKAVTISTFGNVRDVQAADERLARLKADTMCEMVSICIMRSEFEEAKEALSKLIAHTRTTDIFSSFAPRITLLSAYLAHALGQDERALECYRTAAYLDATAGFVRLASRVGEVVLRIGRRDVETKDAEMDHKLNRMVLEVIKECECAGGKFEPVGNLLQAILAREIIEIKKLLKHALEGVGQSLDTHLRALVLALMANMYILTASDHAQKMLKTCQQMAAGLGAPMNKLEEVRDVAIGNLPLGLWVGEKFAELYRREGKEKKAERQEEVNRVYQKAIRTLTTSPLVGDTSGDTTIAASDEMDVDEGVTMKGGT